MEQRNNKKRKKDEIDEIVDSDTTENPKEESKDIKQFEKTPIDLNQINREDYSTIYSSATHFGLNKSSAKTPSLSNSLKKNLFQTARLLQNNPLLRKSDSVPSHMRDLKQLGNRNEIIEQNDDKNEFDDFKDLQGYEIDCEIGYGTFSTVYRAKCKQSGEFVAIKRIIPTCKPYRVLSEIEFIRKLSGKKNIVQMLGGIRKDHQMSLILSYLEHQNFKDFKETATIPEIREYMRGLFIALYHVHDNNIIHRDIKPSNFLSNIEKNKFLLVDFGLAQCVNDSKLKSLKNTVPSRAGTRGFRAPEVLLKCVEQTTAIDMWSAGVILLSLITKRYPFFQSPDDLTSVVEISNICGSKKLIQIADQLGKNLTLPVDLPEICWKELISKLNPSFLLDDSLLDLLSNLMEIHPFQRITARKALFHPFIRNKK